MSVCVGGGGGCGFGWLVGLFFCLFGFCGVFGFCFCNSSNNSNVLPGLRFTGGRDFYPFRVSYTVQYEVMPLVILGAIIPRAVV